MLYFFSRKEKQKFSLKLFCDLVGIMRERAMLFFFSPVKTIDSSELTVFCSIIIFFFLNEMAVLKVYDISIHSASRESSFPRGAVRNCTGLIPNRSNALHSQYETRERERERMCPMTMLDFSWSYHRRLRVSSSEWDRRGPPTFEARPTHRCTYNARCTVYILQELRVRERERALYYGDSISQNSI